MGCSGRRRSRGEGRRGALGIGASPFAWRERGEKRDETIAAPLADAASPMLGRKMMLVVTEGLEGSKFTFVRDANEQTKPKKKRTRRESRRSGAKGR
jgi:hypothetical protein